MSSWLERLSSLEQHKVHVPKVQQTSWITSPQKQVLCCPVSYIPNSEYERISENNKLSQGTLSPTEQLWMYLIQSTYYAILTNSGFKYSKYTRASYILLYMFPMYIKMGLFYFNGLL